MKKTILFIFFMLILFITIKSQNDTLFIMKNGFVESKLNIFTDIDSIIFYKPSSITGIFNDPRDGNTYNWIRIGDQIWMTENLKYLPSVVDSDSSSITNPLYYVYGNIGTNISSAKTLQTYSTYGVLYNWSAAMAGFPSSNSNPSEVQGVCPLGWHLPSIAEWTQLSIFLGGDKIAGTKLKATTLWRVSNTGATNESGFTALPGGYQHYHSFSLIEYYGFFWSSTELNSQYANFGYFLFNVQDFFQSNYYKSAGLSVRCVKN